MTLNTNHISKLLNYEKIKGGLYIVSTPIGNLSDITIRALKILLSSDLIICEDTRVSKKLTSNYEIKTKMQPFHKFNSSKLIPSLIKKLQSNQSICLISDSGTPLISDPGQDLVKKCLENNIDVFSVPGPSAVIASLVVSGFQSINFSFRGFFPRNKKNIKLEVESINRSDCPIVFFESPKRILKTLKIIYSSCGNCKISFIRELTKKYEEKIITNISNLITNLEARDTIKGEITIIIMPSKQKSEKKVPEDEIIKISDKLMKNGLNISEISRVISHDLNIPKRNIYQLLIKKRK